MASIKESELREISKALTKVFVNEWIILEELTINFEVDILCFFSIFIHLLSQCEFVVIVNEIVGYVKSFFKVLNLPALLWLATDIERHKATSHVVLYRHRCPLSFKKNWPINTSCVCTVVLFDHGVTNLRHFNYIFVLR